MAAVTDVLARRSDAEVVRDAMTRAAPAAARAAAAAATAAGPPAAREVAMPTSVHDDVEPLLSAAFPVLFPDGAGDFVACREHRVDFGEWVVHALRWHDGRFARHGRFACVAWALGVAREVSAGGEGGEARARTSEPRRRVGVVAGAGM
jgi:hypothetical protein